MRQIVMITDGKPSALTQPDEVYWCDGSDEEYEQLAQTLVAAGTFERLSLFRV